MKRILFYFCFALLALSSSAALAYTHDGVEIEPLFFGQIIITDNSAVRSCTIPASGAAMTCDSQITILKTGQYGVVRLSGYDPSLAVTAWVDDSGTTLSDGGSFVFDVKTFTFAPDINVYGGTAQNPAGGALTLKIGATLKTRAGVSYDIAPYRGTFTLLINY
jgi:hypothetical protein